VPEEQSEFADSSFVRGKENEERGRISGTGVDFTNILRTLIPKAKKEIKVVKSSVFLRKTCW